MVNSDVDTALRLVTSLPEFVHLRIGYESAGWAERAVERADPDHPLYAAAVGFAARGAWNRGEQSRARSLAALANGRAPASGNGRIAYPGDVLADVVLYEGDAAAALAHYDAEVSRARRDNDSIRLVWTLFYVAICHSALRSPEDGLAAAAESVRVADETANPTARSMARYALGLVLKKSEPDRALALFDGAAELAASVQNFWWHGIALMEAAATRAVHRRPGDWCSAPSLRCSTIGTGWGTGVSNGSTCGTSRGFSSGWAPKAMLLHCITRSSAPAGSRRWGRLSSPRSASNSMRR